MAVVADWRRIGALARAQQRPPIALDRPFQRLDAGALVRAIAERLGLRATAAAPPIGLARDQFDQHRLAPADFRLIAHAAPLPFVYRMARGWTKVRAPLPPSAAPNRR